MDSGLFNFSKRLLNLSLLSNEEVERHLPRKHHFNLCIVEDRGQLIEDLLKTSFENFEFKLNIKSYKISTLQKQNLIGFDYVFIVVDPESINFKFKNMFNKVVGVKNLILVGSSEYLPMSVMSTQRLSIREIPFPNSIAQFQSDLIGIMFMGLNGQGEYREIPPNVIANIRNLLCQSKKLDTTFKELINSQLDELWKLTELFNRSSGVLALKKIEMLLHIIGKNELALRAEIIQQQIFKSEYINKSIKTMIISFHHSVNRLIDNILISDDESV